MNTEQERTDLLPCPFCGEVEGLIIQHCEGTIIHPALRIYCDNCGGSNGYTDKGDHVENWNRRAALQHSCKEASHDKEDAERYRCLSSMATQQADSLGPIFRIDVRRTPQTLFNFDAAVDLACRAEEEGNKCS